MDNTEKIRLIEAAEEARKTSYAPYSDFHVGAALLTKTGRIYKGCNIENAAYGPSVCAERTAIFKAVSEGERECAAIAITGGYDDADRGVAYPCGVCRQVMAEFADPDEFIIIVAASENEFRTCTLKELLPYSFGPKNLK